MKRSILCVSVVVIGIFLSPGRLFADDESVVSLTPKGVEQPLPSRELLCETVIPFGNVKLLGNAEGVKLRMTGCEYDVPLKVRFLRSNIYYGAEVMSAMLWAPEKVNSEGDPLSTRHKVTPGIGISPIIFRFSWREGRRVMPFFQASGFVFGFNKKVLSPTATYELWSFRTGVGVTVRLFGSYDLRIEAPELTHISDAWVVHSNPGHDGFSVAVGLVYHLKDRHWVQ